MRLPLIHRLALVLALSVTLCVTDGVAEDPAVPVGLQVELLARVAGYDRNFSGRAGDKAHVLVVARPGNLDSTSVSREALRAFRATPQIAGIPVEAVPLDYASAAGLVDEAKRRKASIVYFAPGFSDEAAKLASAFTGLDVLTVSSVPSDVEKGIVLGFDLASGRPKLLVHLTQARRQNAAFKAEALKLMKVYE